MKIIVAPNAFKGTITAREASTAISEAIRGVIPNADVIDLPISDGGDGSLSIFLEIFNGVRQSCVVSGPLGEPVTADWAILNDGKTAFIETALAFGLALLPNNLRNPSLTTSRGVGELILYGLDMGIRDFIIAVGGSANNDGGKGMLQALGIQFLNIEGDELEEGGLALQTLDRIIIKNIDPRIKESHILLLADSSVPLTGEIGVSIMYSPGKGASREMSIALDNALKHYAKVVRNQFGIDLETMSCAGAGGGVVSAAEVFLKASREYGIEIVLEKLKFNNLLKNADLVVTGEGQIDEQTIYFKAPIGVAKAARQANIPVLAICARLAEGYEKVFEHGIDAIGVIAHEDGWCDHMKIVDINLLQHATEDIFLQLKSNDVSSIKHKRFFFKTK